MNIDHQLPVLRTGLKRPVSFPVVLAVLSPPLAVLMAAALNRPYEEPWGRRWGLDPLELWPAVSACGSALGGLLAGRSIHGRGFKGFLGAAFGYCGFWGVLIVTFLLSMILK